MTAETMTRCPDLDAAVDALAFTAAQLRGLEERIRTMDVVKDYKQLGRLSFERDDCRADLISKARTLNMPWRTLLMFVEETARLRKKHGGRRPNPQMLENAVEAIRAGMERAALESDAAIVLLKLKNEAARESVADANAALAYMEASRP